MIVAGFVYIVNAEKVTNPTETVLELSTKSLTFISTENRTLTSNGTQTSQTTTVTPDATSTVTDFNVINVTKTFTSFLPSGTVTVTSFVTSTISETVTQTVTGTIQSTTITTTAAGFSIPFISCTSKDLANNNHATCSLQISNGSGASTTISGCTLQIGGVATPGTLAVVDGGGATVVQLNSGASTRVWCLGPAAGGYVGTYAYGSVALGNGDSLAFTGTWQ